LHSCGVRIFTEVRIVGREALKGGHKWVRQPSFGVVREGANGGFGLGTNKAILDGGCGFSGFGGFCGFALGFLICFAFGLDLDQFAAGGVEEAGFSVFVDAESVEVFDIFRGVGGLRESVVQLGISFAWDVVGFGAHHGHDVGGLGSHLLRGPGDVAQGLDEDLFGDAFWAVFGAEVFEVAAEGFLFVVGDDHDVAGVAVLESVHAGFLFRGFGFWTGRVLGIFAIRV